MNYNKLNFYSGNLIYWDLDDLDLTKKFIHQIDILKEDLAQIAYPNNILLDLGWYPSFDATGSFVLTLIKDENWDTPIEKSELCNIEELINSIEKLALKANDLSKEP